MVIGVGFHGVWPQKSGFSQKIWGFQQMKGGCFQDVTSRTMFQKGRLDLVDFSRFGRGTLGGSTDVFFFQIMDFLFWLHPRDFCWETTSSFGLVTPRFDWVHFNPIPWFIFNTPGKHGLKAQGTKFSSRSSSWNRLNGTLSQGSP